MTIVVGYTPTPPGRAALVAAAGVAGERNQPVVVVNSSRGDALADPGFATQADLDWARTTLEEAGVEFSIRQSVRGQRSLGGGGDRGGGSWSRTVRHRDPAPHGVGKMLMGSNAHRILMDAPCPVLAVKAVDHD